MKYTAALLVTIAAFAASATAAPALCSEAARFGFFNLEQTKATEGQVIAPRLVTTPAAHSKLTPSSSSAYRSKSP